MELININAARKFSLEEIQKNKLIHSDDIQVQLICFEAGQRDDEDKHGTDCIYQVLEGEALVRVGEESRRLGKGKLLHVPAGKPHVLENAGGGLLVVMATSRPE